MTRYSPGTATTTVSRLVKLFALLAFLLQGLVVQTHIHGVPLTVADHILKASAPSQPAPNDPYDPANCPLCQEILHAGVFVAPAPVLLAIPSGVVTFAPDFLIATLIGQTSYPSWQSRAPPRH